MKTDPQQARAATHESSSQVRAAVQEAGDVFDQTGLRVTEATGSWSVCSSNPPRLKYSGGGHAQTKGKASAAAIHALSRALVDAGWVETSSGSGPRPYATLERNELILSLGESRRYPGAVTMSVTGPCIDTTEEQDSLLGETDRIIS
jgi:hypothetical protein